MRILVLSISNEGTIGKCSANLCKAFQNSGVELSICYLYRYSNGSSIFEKSEYLVDRTEDTQNDVSFFKKIKWVKKIKKRERPDITISTLVAVNLLNVLTGGKGKKIGVFHAPIEQAKEFGMFYYLKLYITYLLLFPFLDLLSCVSREVEDSVKSVLTIPKNKIKVIYNAHDKEQIEQFSEEPLDETASFVMKRFLLYCGRIDDNKAPDRAIEAFCNADIKDDYHLVIIGPDPYDKWGLIKEKIPVAFQNRIIYLGSQPNPYKFMKKAVALITSSYSEGLPGVVIESLLLKRPVLSTNSSRGVWEIFSADAAYKEDLDGLFENECGIITSNLSAKSSSHYDLDIQNLTRGIERISKKGEVKEFDFSREVNFAAIVNKYISSI